MDVRRENRLHSAAKQPANRGGLWSLGEVLDELMPRYAPAADIRAEPVVVGRLDLGWRAIETELAACL